MNSKSIRTIFLIVSIATGIVGWVYHIFSSELNIISTNISLFFISGVCLSLFVFSYLKLFRNDNAFLVYIFKITLSGWFIIITALNHFPADYSYFLIFVTLMLSMLNANAKEFAIFYLASFIVLLFSSIVIRNPLIEVGTFNILFFACGLLMFFILRSKENTQHKLENNLQSMKQVVENSLGFFFFLDQNFRIISFNNFAKEIFIREMKKPLEEGESIFNYFPPDTHESLRNTLTKCLKGEIINNEKQVTFPGGPQVWVENIFIPVYDDAKKFLGISFQTRRINERKEAEEVLKESEEKFHQLADNIEDAIWISDGNNFIYVNDSLEKIWGRKKEVFIDNPSVQYEWVHPEDLPHLLELMNSEEYLKNRKLNEQYRIIRPDGNIRWVWLRSFPIQKKSGDVNRTVGILSDITERKETESKINQQYEFMQSLINTIPNPIFYKDEKGKYLGCNTNFELSIGGNKENLIGKSVYELSPRELAEVYDAKDQELFKNPGLQIYESKVKYLDGSVHDVIFHKATFIKNDGSIGGLVGVILDITDRKRFEEALRLSEERFKEMADTLPLLVYETDDTGNITYFNKSGFEYTGYSMEDFNKGLTLPMMFPPREMERAIENAKQTMTGSYVGSIEYTLKRKDGSLYPAIINTVPIMREGKVVGRRGVVTDISEIKMVEDRVKASLKEKEILLREIHHRVKNNLQVISSMLRLQSSNLDDERIKEVFNDAQSRVLAMSLVHEKLYKADNFSSIYISDYVSDLVSSIVTSHKVDQDKILINLYIDSLSINLDTMIPVGLIINELVTNSLKHAFPNGNKGTIEIHFKRKEAKFYLSIKDNGIGILKDIDIDNIKSLGLRLVQTLVTQINGDLLISNDNGSLFCITFEEIQKRQQIPEN